MILVSTRGRGCLEVVMRLRKFERGVQGTFMRVSGELYMRLASGTLQYSSPTKFVGSLRSAASSIN